MRTLCPNLDREDALETVLEVPIPEEMFASNKHKSWQNMKSWMMRPQVDRPTSVFGGRAAEIQFLLGVVGAPLIPLPIRCDRTVNDNIKDHPIESSMAKYIVQQYIAAAGGEHALNSIDSMYAVGKVKMAASEFVAGDDLISLTNSKVTKMKNMKHGPGEIGGFVLWQKSPDLWSLSLMVQGIKSVLVVMVRWLGDKLHGSTLMRPAVHLGLFVDPCSFGCNSICIGEKTIKNEDCFVLKLEADSIHPEGKKQQQC
ncbi:UNVERIFIED_CONTAM: hypothetical protein Scaly_0495100 [Sesamum calycinum]|uniref:Uncharacterized protein n=1 Tax=Sesamum calycinum TaxID=2727403 RepID=A0AAW2RPN9_9LAMI